MVLWYLSTPICSSCCCFAFVVKYYLPQGLQSFFGDGSSPRIGHSANLKRKLSVQMFPCFRSHFPVSLFQNRLLTSMKRQFLRSFPFILQNLKLWRPYGISPAQSLGSFGAACNGGGRIQSPQMQLARSSTPMGQLFEFWFTAVYQSRFVLLEALVCSWIHKPEDVYL